MKNLMSTVLCLGMLTPVLATAYSLNTKPKIGSVNVAGTKENDYYKLAKVSLIDAVGTAVEQFPGKATEAELDDKDGFLVYEVKIRGDDGASYKVLVDAGDKSVLLDKKTQWGL